ncbi:HSP90 family protein [Myceligenerans indicum]|uniref:HSP90 family protein n=1 Tax=Myceligenerans indicum TaxID=2593663 RepID=A0ABS1LJY7_9MICO|nr:HSP90 family protein [Myceligenerans indicum]MBL0886516.1 HSP90 family protein [Myceligenerans indicum]
MTSEKTPTTSHAFQVDLHGLVDLLSQHLYASPRVYVRELLQNAVDAITARRASDPTCPGTVGITADGTSITLTDSGIGLTEPEVHRLLATIGRSSKRNDLESARRDFLGQFGIGLLACFVVADTIRVVSRSASGAGAEPVEWVARADGSYTVRQLTPAEYESATGTPAPGTTVRLDARHGCEQWFVPDTVSGLATEFGALLPYAIAVNGDPITGRPAPWEVEHSGPVSRRSALVTAGQEALGFTPLDCVELDLPLVGIRGVAYVVPGQVSPAQRGGHRVYLKRMLLTDTAEGLLPDWAFFVRCVLDTDSLRPTASREALYEDETLSAVREALGERIRQWLAQLAVDSPERLRRLIGVHHLGVKALALHDEEVLRTMLPWLPFETTDGELSLDEVARRTSTLHFTRTVDEFRQVSAVATAQGMTVVNGGYTYDADLVARLPEIRPGITVSELDSNAVAVRLDTVDPAQELAMAAFLSVARGQLDPLDCDVAVREFHPSSIPALHLDDRAARHERRRADAEVQADELWSGILSSLHETRPRSQLVLNHLNPLARRVMELTDPELAGVATEALYGQALLQARRPLRPVDQALVNRAFAGLLERAAPGSPPNTPDSTGKPSTSEEGDR